MYRRASKKQLDYIAKLCDELMVTNKSLYSKYSLDQATRYIKQLKKKVDMNRKVNRQTKLF